MKNKISFKMLLLWMKHSEKLEGVKNLFTARVGNSGLDPQLLWRLRRERHRVHHP